MRKRFYFLNQAPLGIGEWGADRSTHSSPAPSSNSFLCFAITGVLCNPFFTLAIPASQDKIFHGLSRNWIWIENSRATGRGLRFCKCSFSITTDWLGKGKALTWITRSSQGGNISVGGLDWREMPNGLLVLMCFSVTYFVSTGLFSSVNRTDVECLSWWYR